jgi:hypothetical protein
VGRRRSVKAVLILALLLSSLVFAPGASTAAGYTYFGFEQTKPTTGVAARITPLSLAGNGGQAAVWVGIGDTQSGPNGCPLWLQTGIAAIPSTQPFIYVEWNTGTPCSVTQGQRIEIIRFNAPLNTVYRFAIVEDIARRNVWQVWVNGQVVKTVYLPYSRNLDAQVIAESYGGGQVKALFSQARVAHRSGGGWKVMRRDATFQSGTFKAKLNSDNSWLASNIGLP